MTAALAQFPGLVPNEPERVREPVKVSPSSTSFDWQECRCCWWHFYVRRDEKKPRMIMPSIFNKIDRAMRERLDGMPLSAVAPGLPGTIRNGGRVASRPVVPSGCETPVFFSGIMDFVVELDDGSVIVVDGKTSDPKDEHVVLYRRQLHCYAEAIEHPAKGRSGRVSGLALLVFAPQSFSLRDDGTGDLNGKVVWEPLPLERERFNEDFVPRLGALCDMDEAPGPTPGCEACDRRKLLADAKAVLAAAAA